MRNTTWVVLGALLLLSAPAMAAQHWESGPSPMLSPRSGAAAVLGPDDHIYALGGKNQYGGSSYTTNTMEMYDEDAEAWMSKPSMIFKRDHHGTATDSTGGIWAVGGYGTTGMGELKTTERYDGNSWQRMPDLATPRAGLGCVSTGGKIYAIGGLANYAQGTFLNSVERYNPSTSAWEPVEPLNTARCNFGCAVDSDGRIYAIGGTVTGSGAGGGWSETATVERYYPDRNKWYPVAPLPVARGGMSAFLGNGEIYVVGGGTNVGGDYFSAECYIYNPKTDKWREGPPMYEEVNNTAAVVGASGIAYLLGGEGPSIGRVHNRVAVLLPPFRRVVPLDILPDDCPNDFTVNLKSKGRLPMAILGSATFDVSTIDVDTISIGGVVYPVKAPSMEDVSAPAGAEECACQVGTDGYPDLVLHFSRREVIQALGLDTMASGTVVPITVEGQLLDGTPFEATDCVTLVGRK